MNSSADDARADLVPIVIAVTGHRNIPADCRPALEEAAAGLFRILQQRYPSTPLWLMSGLAEGADRLAAEVALRHEVRLVAALPLPPADYEQDFATEESRLEFRRLLAAARETVVTADVSSETAGSRTKFYVKLGVFLVQNCDVLLALWDGEESDSQGGTADVVAYRRAGIPLRADRSAGWQSHRTGAVYHVMTPRLTDPAKQPPAGTVRVLFPAGDDPQSADTLPVDPTLAAIDGLNTDLRELPDTDQKRGPTLGEDEARAGFSQDVQRSLRDLRRRYHQTDTLAVRFQTRTWRVFAVMLACTLLAMICLQIHANVSVSSRIFLILYLSLLLAAYGLYGWSKRNRYESRAFDYRALAEALRIQIYWRMAGIEASVADHYLRRQQSVLHWIRRALLNWTLAPGRRTTDAPTSAPALKLILKHWIGDQLRFFTKTASRQRRLQARLVGIANGLLILGALLGGLKASSDSPNWLYSFAAVPPMIAATLLVFAKTRALSEQVNQYESMRELYQAAEDHLERQLADGDLAGGERLLMDLGHEALAESAEWLILHRRRPVGAPSVGS